jgi:ACR3 family arsenite efflux pump ArsB
MKQVKTILSVLVLVGLPLMASAADQQCHLEQQRSSEFCQKVMFPPIPFR